MATFLSSSPSRVHRKRGEPDIFVLWVSDGLLLNDCCGCGNPGGVPWKCGWVWRGPTELVCFKEGRNIMTIRKLLPLLFLAMVVPAAMPERALAQGGQEGGCVTCTHCAFATWGDMCRLIFPGEIAVGWTNCAQRSFCSCDLEDIWLCFPIQDAAAAAEQDELLASTMAAIGAGESIPADGPFFYLRRGAEFVIRRKCDAAEVGRVAVEDVEPEFIPAVG